MPAGRIAGNKEEKAKIAGKGFPALCFLSCGF